MITTKYSPLSAPIAKNAWGWGRNASLVGDCRLAMACPLSSPGPGHCTACDGDFGVAHRVAVMHRYNRTQ